MVLLFESQAALKKYQTEQRSKGDALDKCQAELKKLRKKSQGSKNPQKYSDKELQVGLGRRVLGALPGDTGVLGPRLWFWDFLGLLVSGEGQALLSVPSTHPSGSRGARLIPPDETGQSQAPLSWGILGGWVPGVPEPAGQQSHPVASVGARGLSTGGAEPRWNLPACCSDSYLGQRSQTVTLTDL